MFLWHAKINLLCRRRAIIAYGTATFTGEYAKLPPKRNPLQVLCAINLMTLFSLLLCVVCVCEPRVGSSAKQFMLLIPFKVVALYQMSSLLFLLSQTLLLHQQSTQKANCLKWLTKENASWLGSMKHFWQNSWFNWSTTLRKNQTKLVKKGRWLFLQRSSTKVISFLCQNFSFAIPKRRHTSIIGER